MLPVTVDVPTTDIFCKKVALVFVLMFSVLATPVKFAPLPTNDDAVTIPANSALPSTLILAATPGLAPISIPVLAVTKPVSYTHLTLPTKRIV